MAANHSSSKFSSDMTSASVARIRVTIARMGRKPTLKPDDPAQSKRFIETAKAVEADDAEALERAFAKIGLSKKPDKGERSGSQ